MPRNRLNSDCESGYPFADPDITLELDPQSAKASETQPQTARGTPQPPLEINRAKKPLLPLAHLPGCHYLFASSQRSTSIHC